ncbi:MAG: diaminopimelate epimerase [Actinomycetes bacterium]|nr:diaminopimelate epimerase [Actinomycetes bacterium]
MKFTKMQGLGNDFIVASDLSGKLKLTTAQVERLCDRRFGIGADGLMLIRTPADPQQADFSWWFANADGSFPEMCGNGSRCFARYVVEEGLIPSGCKEVRLETLAGIKTIRIRSHADGSFAAATVDMGIVKVEDEPVHLLGHDFARVSVGNPHAVAFMDALPMEFNTAPVIDLGPQVEIDPVFPNKTNVEFVHPISMSQIEMRVWERGVGETLACATGAVAGAVASYVRGSSAPEVSVRLPGGSLDVSITPEFRVLMTGPAERVFDGMIDR